MAFSVYSVSAHTIQSLVKLEGRALVSYPYDDTAYPRVERVMKLPIGDWQIAYLTADDETTTCLLIEQKIIGSPSGSDDHYAQVYRLYERVPGPVLTTTTATHAGGFTVDSRQRVLATQQPSVPAGSSTVDKVTQESEATAWRTRTYLLDNAGALATGSIIYQSRDLDPETGTEIVTDHFFDDESYALPTFQSEVKQRNTSHIGYNNSSSYSPAHYCIDAKTYPIEGSPRVLIEIVHCKVPATNVEDLPRGFRFPAIFELSGTINIPASYPGRYAPPWPGNPGDDNRFRLLTHRQNTQCARRVRTYSFGRLEKLPLVYQVQSPGAASKVYNIPAECIHQPIKVYEAIEDGLLAYSVLVEDLPSSTPASYDPRDILVAEAEEKQWRGAIYCQEVWLVSESLPLSSFPDPASLGYYTVKVPFRLTPTPALSGQPSPAKKLYIQTNNSEHAYVTIYGRDETGAAISDTADGDNSTLQSTGLEFGSVLCARLTSPLASDTATLYGAVDPDYAALRFIAIPTDGHKLKVGVAGSEVTYIILDTPATTNDVQRATTRKGMATNILQAIRGNSAYCTTPHPNIRAEKNVADATMLNFYTINPTSNVANVATDLTLLTLDASNSNTTAWGQIFAWASGSAAETIAVFTAGQTLSFDITTLASPKLDDTSPDNDAKAGANLPPAVVTYTDWVACPTPALTIVANATGTPLMGLQYQNTASTTLATVAKTVSVTNGSTAITISGYLSAWDRCAILIGNDPQENELIGTVSPVLRRAYAGTTGASTSSTITVCQAVTVGNLLRGARRKLAIGAKTGYIRLKFTQSSTHLKTRAVDAHLEYRVS